MPPDRRAEDEEDQNRWTAHIDAAVTEVFEWMMQQCCTVADDLPAAPAGISAAITFSGTLEGQCIVQVSTATADLLTDAMLGAEGDWDDQMVEDAVGELCNMIAGGWKSRLDEPASTCRLSIPAISRGALPGQPRSVSTARRSYGFHGAVLEVVLALHEECPGSPDAETWDLSPGYFTTDWNNGDVSRLENSLSEDE